MMDRDTRDVTLVILLSLVVLAVIAWAVTHTDRSAAELNELFGRWGGFIGTTGIVFGLAMK